MKNGPHEIMSMGGGPHKMIEGEKKYKIRTEDGKEIEWIEDIDIQKEEGKNGEKKVKIKVNATKEKGH